MAASIKMQGPGAFVFSFFDYKLVLMPVIIMYVNLFSFSTNKVGPLALLHILLPPGKGFGERL